jgi:pimeloyl-ACP methyl ester carboxylesterase
VPQSGIGPRARRRFVPGLIFAIVAFAFPQSAANAQALTFTPIAHPQSGLNFITGINDDDVAVGYYQIGGNVQSRISHGLIYDHGTLTYFDGPLPTFPGQSTEALAINNSGQILIRQGSQYFLYSGGSNGTFQPIGLKGVVTATKLPFTLSTITGFNDMGQIVGTYNSGGNHGVYGIPALGAEGTTTPPSTAGDYTQFDCPAGRGGLANTAGIDNSPRITGNCGGGSVPGPGFAIEGFIHFGGNTTTFFDPIPFSSIQNVYNTQGFGISPGGVAGRYQFTQAGNVPFPFKGIIYDGSDYTEVVPPDASGSIATGINSRGVIVGYYYSPVDGIYYGFITSPLIRHAPITITTSTLPDGAVGRPYDSGQLQATGGSGSYGWTLSSGILPSGFSLLPGGKILGLSTANAQPGKYPLRIRATDLNGTDFAERDFTLLILPMVTILDPVPQLLSGAQITANRTVLASQGRPVLGIASDGIAQVVLRIPTLNKGDRITATVLSDRCTDPSTPSTCTLSGSSDDNGGLFNVGGPVTSAQSLPNNASDVSDSTTSDAFIAYRAPIDFARPTVASDTTLASRTIYLQFTYSSGNTPYGSQIVPLTIVRPPLAFIHGFNTDSSAWDTFTPLIDNISTYAISKINYGAFTTQVICTPTGFCTFEPARVVNGRPLTIIDTIPSISLVSSFSPGALMRQSHLGFSFNALPVGDDIIKSILTFRQGSNPLNMPVAAAMSDVVAHSMGGLVARYWSTLRGSFISPLNYNQGYIHKLITLGTPHYGTPQAILSVLPETACSRNLAAVVGSMFFSSALLSDNKAPVPGAAGEMSADGIGQSLSVALEAIKSKAFAIPMATLAGDVTPIEGQIDSSPVSLFTWIWCAGEFDPLAARYHSWLFDEVFDPNITAANPSGRHQGRANDGSVPVSSAMLNPAITSAAQCPPGQCFPGFTHSSGIVQFFSSSARYLQDGSGVVAQQVEKLLNTSIRVPVFGGQ